MGTTRDALDAGSTSYVLSCVIEGWSEGYTNGSTSAAATAFSGTGWSTFKGGLFVESQISQAMNPDEPIVQMGDCVVTLMPQGTGTADVLGVAVGKKTATYETYLDAAVDNDDTTITVKSTSGWPSSGYLHIGTECIAYSGTTATTFTGCTRGCFTPFGSFANYIAGATTNSFSHIHRVADDANAINLQPVVSSSPRMWIGRWVRIRAHRVVSDVFDTVAEAETLYAGQIADVRDDPNTGAVVFQLRPVTDIADTTIGQAQWEGKANDGVYLTAGMVFGFSDDNTGGVTGKSADNLTVVSSGAVAPYEINAGYYTLGDLCSALSAWLADASSAGDLYGSYTIASPVSIPGGELRTKVYWTLSALFFVEWTFSMPKIVSTFLGFNNVAGTVTTFPSNVRIKYSGASGTNAHWHEGEAPGTVAIIPTGDDGARMLFTTKTGTVQSQTTTIPPSIIQANTGSWGLFLVGKRVLLAQIDDNADGTVELTRIQDAFPTHSKLVQLAFGLDPITLNAGSGDELIFRQIYIFQSDPITMLISLLCSMGSDGYNSPYTALPAGCSASIPYELVSTLPLVMSGLSGITGPAGMTVVLEKPTKLAEIIRSDFAIRMVFLCWRDGGVSMGEWRVPTSTLAVESLSDSNKAEPAGRTTNQKSATTDTSEWLRPIVKVRYNRNASDPSGDDYADSLTFIDQTSVDDMGGAAKTVTISLRNTYSEFNGPAQSVTALLPRFLSILPLVSRPTHKVTRSIDSRYFLRLAPGDVVLLTDVFARDPETGLRGLTARPALVTKVTYNFGGNDIGGGTTPMMGSADLVFSDQNPDKQGAPYVPAAMINDLYSFGSFSHGYDSSGPTLHLLANRFTETTDSGGHDAAYFNPGDLITIVERDPADPDAPTKWTRTIASVDASGDEITLTATLSSPAWDATKQYYVISQTYSAATATQHQNTYQADETDALIEDSTGPYTYGSGGASSTFTTNADMGTLYTFNYVNDVEMPPTLVRIDGAGRDVAWEASIARTLNNLTDYKLQPQLPMVSNVVMSNTTVTGTGYQLVCYFPVWLNFEVPSASIYRLMTAALIAYSTDGTSTKARVTLTRERPSFPTTDNVAWAGTYAQIEWTGITSTTPALLSDGTVTVNIKGALGEAWIAIELGYKCATRGLGKCLVGVRQAV